METDPTKRLWRTLIAVEKMGENEVLVRIPAIDAGRKTYSIKIEEFPAEIIPLLAENYRFYAQVPLGADDHSKVTITQFEFTDNEKGKFGYKMEKESI